MLHLLYLLLATARSSLKPQRELALENLALRQQLAILKRKTKRPKLSKADRAFWVVLCAQCDQTEFPDGPACDCVCSNERVAECYAPQNDDCPPSPSCTSDAECEAFCKSDALCGEAEPKYVACSNDRAGVIELHCEQIPQCQGVTETECRERFERFGCEFEWLFYRLCVSHEGCGSVKCSDDLRGWEACEATEVGGASDSAL